MTARRCIVGVGQRAAGDDGVGHAVLDELRRRDGVQGVELLDLSDPMDLVSLLEEGSSVVLVDAVLGSPPGVVLTLSPDELSRAGTAPSSHGLGAAQAIELSRALAPEAPTRVRIVAVTIERPDRYRIGLSPAIAGAVAAAADRALALSRSPHA